MKNCPLCKKVYENDIRFCYADGTTLVNVSAEPSGVKRGEILNEGILAPTAVVGGLREPTAPWMYILIGSLITALVGAVFVFVFQTGRQDSITVSTQTPGNSNSISPSTSPTPSGRPVARPHLRSTTSDTLPIIFKARGMAGLAVCKRIPYARIVLSARG